MNGQHSAPQAQAGKPAQPVAQAPAIPLAPSANDEVAKVAQLGYN